VIHHRLYGHPIVSKVIDEAHAIVKGWYNSCSKSDQEILDHVLAGWGEVSLAQRIARALLEKNGITGDDLDLFNEIIDGDDSNASDAALFELWDSERRKDERHTSCVVCGSKHCDGEAPHDGPPPKYHINIAGGCWWTWDTEEDESSSPTEFDSWREAVIAAWKHYESKQGDE